jgi:hypothetical protein
MAWTNADGLRVLKFGEQGQVQDKGVTTVDVVRTIVVDVDLTKVKSTFGAADIDPMDPVIPAGAYIVNADLIITTGATSGGGATLTIGTYNAAGTAIDADGIDNAIAITAIDVANDIVQNDGAQVNGIVTVGNADAYIGMTFGTAAFTAGRGKLVIQYIKV